MPVVAASLILVSAVIHATWNIMARHSHTKSTFIWYMLMPLATVGLVPGLAAALQLDSITPTVWAYVMASGFCCGLYFFSLGKAYTIADFTTVYPVARSLPVLLVAAGDVLRGARPTVPGWMGMVLVVAGCLIAPLESFAQLEWRRYWNKASFWMVLTALGTVGYSLLDKRSSELLVKGPVTALVYTYLFYLFSFASYWLITGIRGGFRPRPLPEGTSLTVPALAGLFSFLGYFLVVWAYQMVEQASYVVAFRQSSLVVGVLMAFAFYREERHWVRLAAVLVITLGLILISLYG